MIGRGVKVLEQFFLVQTLVSLSLRNDTSLNTLPGYLSYNISRASKEISSFRPVSFNCFARNQKFGFKINIFGALYVEQRYKLIKEEGKNVADD